MLTKWTICGTEQGRIASGAVFALCSRKMMWSSGCTPTSGHSKQGANWLFSRLSVNLTVRFWHKVQLRSGVGKPSRLT